MYSKSHTEPPQTVELNATQWVDINASAVRMSMGAVNSIFSRYNIDAIVSKTMDGSITVKMNGKEMALTDKAVTMMETWKEQFHLKLFWIISLGFVPYTLMIDGDTSGVGGINYKILPIGTSYCHQIREVILTSDIQMRAISRTGIIEEMPDIYSDFSSTPKMPVPLGVMEEIRLDGTRKMDYLGQEDQGVYVMTGFGYDPYPNGTLRSIGFQMAMEFAKLDLIMNESIFAMKRSNNAVPWVTPAERPIGDRATINRQMGGMLADDEDNDVNGITNNRILLPAVANQMKEDEIRRIRNQETAFDSSGNLMFRTLNPGDKITDPAKQTINFPDLEKLHNLKARIAHRAVYLVDPKDQQANTRQGADSVALREESAVRSWAEKIGRFLTVVYRHIMGRDNIAFSEIGIAKKKNVNRKARQCLTASITSCEKLRSEMLQRVSTTNAKRYRKGIKLEKRLKNLMLASAVDGNTNDLTALLIDSDIVAAKKDVYAFYKAIVDSLEPTTVLDLFDMKCSDVEDISINPNDITVSISIVSKRDMSMIITAGAYDMLTPIEVMALVRRQWNLPQLCEGEMMKSNFVKLKDRIAADDMRAQMGLPILGSRPREEPEEIPDQSKRQKKHVVSDTDEEEPVDETDQ